MLLIAKALLYKIRAQVINTTVIWAEDNYGQIEV